MEIKYISWATCLIALITLLGCYAAKDHDVNKQIWWYNQIFPATFNITFHTTATAHECFRQTNEKVKVNPNLGALSFACADYKTSEEIAKQDREGSFNRLHPVLVDDTINLMCFLVVSPPSSGYTSIKGFEFNTFVPDAIKLHDSIYDYVAFGEVNNLRDGEIGIAYRPEIFGLSQNESTRNAEKYFHERIQTLLSYDMKIFDTFFWTSLETNKFFYSSNDPSFPFLSDRNRNRVWEDKKMAIEQLNNERSNENPDPCDFRKLTKEMIVFDEMIFLPFSNIVNSFEHNSVSACFAYIVAYFAQETSVHHIALRNKPELLNYRARSIQQTASISSDLSNSIYSAAGLLGDDQIIGIADTGIDYLSCYFYDPHGHVTPTDISSPSYDLRYRKVVQYNYNGCGDTSDAEEGHGTHVSGIAVGNKLNANINTDGQYDGVAPNAKVSFGDYGKPGTGLCIPAVNQLYGAPYNAGARVFSNSWGSYFAGTNYYTGSDQDAYLFRNQNQAIFFAMGNIGSRATATTTAAAKNVIAVGSSQSTLGSSNIQYVAFYSSQGPTYDNRIKPDIVAPGHGLMSAHSAGTTSKTCSEVFMTGTSMATPAAAGIGLLIRQYFQDPQNKFWTAICNPSYRTCRNFSPSGSLIKGILAHSGSPMILYNGGGSNDIPLGAPPDTFQGFGRITLNNVLPLKDKVTSFDLFIANAVNIGENTNLQYKINVQRSEIQLKATLVWFDPPNVEGTTTKALINDLNLVLVAPNNKQYHANGLPGYDSLNTIEKIIIDNPQTGAWKAVVVTKALPMSGNQLFSLVITSGGTVSY